MYIAKSMKKSSSLPQYEKSMSPRSLPATPTPTPNLIPNSSDDANSNKTEVKPMRK